MDAILLAGGEIQPGDPLYPVTQGCLRAMIEIAGRPMLHWVLQALDGASRISRIVIVGVPPEVAIESRKPLALVSEQGTARKNILAGAQEVINHDPLATHAVLISVDIPTVTSEIIDWLVEQVETLANDLDYTVIERKTMEGLFPHAKKTYMHLKELDVCGGDLHCIRLGFAQQDHVIWDRLFERGQGPLRQAALLGYDTLLILVLRQLNLRQAEARVSKRMGIQGHALLCPYPQVGLDVNKPVHLEAARDYLARGAAPDALKGSPLDE